MSCRIAFCASGEDYFYRVPSFCERLEPFPQTPWRVLGLASAPRAPRANASQHVAVVIIVVAVIIPVVVIIVVIVIIPVVVIIVVIVITLNRTTRKLWYKIYTWVCVLMLTKNNPSGNGMAVQRQKGSKRTT